MPVAPIRRGVNVAMLLVMVLVVVCLVAPCVEGFLFTPAAAGGVRRRVGGVALEGAGGRRIAAATDAAPLTVMHLQLDMGWGADEEGGDFYNPDGIKEGETVEIVVDSIFYSIPKAPKEGVNPKGFKGTVASLKFTAKNGVVCSANRPVVVKFTEPYKFQGHFEFREVKRV